MDPRIIVIILLVGIVFGLSFVRIFPKRNLGYLLSTLVGLVGSVIGYFLFDYLNVFNMVGMWGVLIQTLIGSVLILVLVSFFLGKRN